VGGFADLKRLPKGFPDLRRQCVAEVPSVEATAVKVALEAHKRY
jgi:hypothetical protein